MSARHLVLPQSCERLFRSAPALVSAAACVCMYPLQTCYVPQDWMDVDRDSFLVFLPQGAFTRPFLSSYAPRCTCDFPDLETCVLSINKRRVVLRIYQLYTSACIAEESLSNVVFRLAGFPCLFGSLRICIDSPSFHRAARLMAQTDTAYVAPFSVFSILSNFASKTMSYVPIYSLLVWHHSQPYIFCLWYARPTLTRPKPRSPLFSSPSSSPSSSSSSSSSTTTAATDDVSSSYSSECLIPVSALYCCCDSQDAESPLSPIYYLPHPAASSRMLVPYVLLQRDNGRALPSVRRNPSFLPIAAAEHQEEPLRFPPSPQFPFLPATLFHSPIPMTKSEFSGKDMPFLTRCAVHMLWNCSPILFASVMYVVYRLAACDLFSSRQDMDIVHRYFLGLLDPLRTPSVYSVECIQAFLHTCRSLRCFGPSTMFSMHKPFRPDFILFSCQLPPRALQPPKTLLDRLDGTRRRCQPDRLGGGIPPLPPPHLVFYTPPSAASAILAVYSRRLDTLSARIRMGFYAWFGSFLCPMLPSFFSATESIRPPRLHWANQLGNTKILESMVEYVPDAIPLCDLGDLLGHPACLMYKSVLLYRIDVYLSRLQRALSTDWEPTISTPFLHYCEFRDYVLTHGCQISERHILVSVTQNPHTAPMFLLSICDQE